MMKTVLHALHGAAGARFTEFCGWEMPARYAKGVIYEHQAVRRAVGIFDVSHMGQIVIQGPEAEKLLEHLATNVVSGKEDGTATYTVWASEEGGCIDDLLVYRLSGTDFFVIVNAGNRQKALKHVQRIGEEFDVVIKDRFEDWGIIALQGPRSERVLSKVVPKAADLKPFRLVEVPWKEKEPLIVARTGYTGEHGYELIAPSKYLCDLWERLMKTGGEYGIEPCGLGARDTLRLEMGYALYGHELSMTIGPGETVANWAVKRSKENFVGKEAIVELDESSRKRKQYGIVLQGRGIARGGCPVFCNGEEVGTVTSGTQSPTLHCAIAIVMVKGKLTKEDTIEVAIRDNKVRAELVKLPFLKSLCKK